MAKSALIRFKSKYDGIVLVVSIKPKTAAPAITECLIASFPYLKAAYPTPAPAPVAVNDHMITLCFQSLIFFSAKPCAIMTELSLTTVPSITFGEINATGIGINDAFSNFYSVDEVPLKSLSLTSSAILLAADSVEAD